MTLIDSRVVHGILWRIPPLVLLISFLIPSMGVMLNHHFPERDPYHSHLANVAKHNHISFVQHVHQESDVPISSTPIFLTKNLGMGSTGIYIDSSKTGSLVPNAPLKLTNLSTLTIDLYKGVTSTVEIPPPIQF